MPPNHQRFFSKVPFLMSFQVFLDSIIDLSNETITFITLDLRGPQTKCRMSMSSVPGSRYSSFVHLRRDAFNRTRSPAEQMPDHAGAAYISFCDSAKACFNNNNNNNKRYNKSVSTLEPSRRCTKLFSSYWTQKLATTRGNGRTTSTAVNTHPC